MNKNELVSGLTAVNSVCDIMLRWGRVIHLLKIIKFQYLRMGNWLSAKILQNAKNDPGAANGCSLPSFQFLQLWIEPSVMPGLDDASIAVGIRNQ